MTITKFALAGKRVLNIHRQSCDFDKSYRDSYKGVIVNVHEGCNPTIVVKYDGSEFESFVPPQDLAFCDLWPNEGCRLV